MKSALKGAKQEARQKRIIKKEPEAKKERKVIKDAPPPPEKPKIKDDNLFVDVQSPGFFDLFVTVNASKHAWAILASSVIIAWYVLKFEGVPSVSVGQEQFWYFVAAFATMNILILLAEMFVSFVLSFIRTMESYLDLLLDILPGLSTVLWILSFFVQLCLRNLVANRLNLHATAIMYVFYSSIGSDRANLGNDSQGALDILFLGNSIPLRLPGSKSPYDTGDAFCRGATVGTPQFGRLGDFPYESLARKLNVAILGLAASHDSSFTSLDAQGIFDALQFESNATTESPPGFLSSLPSTILSYLYTPFTWSYQNFITPFVIFMRSVLNCTFYGFLIFASTFVGAMGADALFTWSMSFALSSSRNIGLTSLRLSDQLNQNIIKQYLYSLGIPDYSGYVQFLRFVRDENITGGIPALDNQALALAYQYSGAAKDRAWVATPSRKMPGDQLFYQYSSYVKNWVARQNPEYDLNISEFGLNIRKLLYQERYKIIQKVFTFENVYLLRYSLASLGYNLAFVMSADPSKRSDDFIGYDKLKEMFWIVPDNAPEDIKQSAEKNQMKILEIAKYLSYGYVESNRFLEFKAFASDYTNIIYPTQFDMSVRFEQIV